VTCLHSHFGGQLLSESFSVSPAALDHLIETSKLIAWLEADRCLAQAKRQKCIDQVKGLPAQIRIATDVSRVSFDVVVQQAGHTFYWEFHEEQHRDLTVNRLQLIYGPDGHEYRVPRFLQRPIRDVWRIKTFPNVSVVWHDWFEGQGSSYTPAMIHGFREYHLESNFSFKAFCMGDSSI
jgi:hypothetical protein